MTRTRCEGCETGGLDFDFLMALQPIVAIREQRIWGYEALVRGTAGEGAATVLAWVNDQNRYRFDQMCRVKAIETAGQLFRDPELHLSINFMPNAVYEPSACIRTTLAAAAKVGFAHDKIMFEFTENERMDDVAKVTHIVNEYKRFGFITALDDFGAGYAGLGLLAKFQPDLIKVDMDLVRDIHRSRPKQAILRAIMTLSQDIGIAVLAEGVEVREEAEVLRAAGVTFMQGYYFAKPTLGILPPVRFTLAPFSEAC